MWLYFFFATVIIQIVFMNLLIAIMSEQYARLNDAKDENKRKEVCKIMADNTWLLKPHEIFEKERYILYIGPDQD